MKKFILNKLLNNEMTKTRETIKWRQNWMTRAKKQVREHSDTVSS